MFSIRKLTIIAASFFAVVIIYIVTVNILDSNLDAENYDYRHTEDINALDIDSNALGAIGELELGKLENANYTVRDENTKKITRIFGFSKLIRQSGENWEIEKPDMKLFEKNFSCQLSADTGIVQIEMIGSQPTPKDSQLSGNVVIRIEPSNSEKMKESFIYLDDVIFNSQNSQFSTDGPVRFISQDAEMVGKGLELIYNSLDGRIELLHIIDLDYVYIKSMPNSSSNKPNNHREVSDSNLPQPDLKNENIITQNQSSQNDINDINHTSPKSPNSNDKPRYRCLFKNNVIIKYGSQYIYADEVALNNIIFSDNSDNAKPIEEAESDVDTKELSPDAKTAKTAVADGEITPISKSDEKDILVKCKGGITVRPMEYYHQQSTNRVIEFTGESVEIKKANSLQNNEFSSIASCSILKYDIDSEILSLKPNFEKYVSVFLEQADAVVQTKGLIELKLNGNSVLIEGPGKIFTKSNNNQLNDESQDVSFGGKMHVFFKDNINQQIDKLEISHIDIAGGIQAKQNSQGDSDLKAENATLVFGNSNNITKLLLSGNVDISNDAGKLKAPSADIHFSQSNPLAENKQISYIDFEKGMTVEGKKNSEGSNVAADSGRFYFGQSQELKQANLRGNVFVDSDKGLVLAENATVMFDKDANGNTITTKISGSGNAQIRAESDNSNTGSFTAQTINYDLISGVGTAKGPVKFVFWTTEITDSNKSQRPYPVIITAEDDTVFSSSKKQIQLSGNVIGHIRQDNTDFFQQSYFYADRMNIYLGSDSQKGSDTDLFGGGDIKKISLLGDKVRLNSEKTKDSQRLSAIEMVCKKMDYDAENEIIQATGSAEIAEIQIDNSKTQTEQSASGKISMKRPSYALIKHFDTLKWFLKKNRIEADGDMKRLYAGFLPVNADGSIGDKSIVNCGRVEAVFTEPQPGKTEISTVLATKGISFEDKRYQFEGGNLFYETGTSFVRITGTPGRNCMFNGAVVDAIEYNLETGKASAEAGQTPGAIQMQ